MILFLLSWGSDSSFVKQLSSHLDTGLLQLYLTSLLGTSLLSFEKTIFGLHFWPRDFAADKVVDYRRKLVNLNKNKIQFLLLIVMVISSFRHETKNSSWLHQILKQKKRRQQTFVNNNNNKKKTKQKQNEKRSDGRLPISESYYPLLSISGIDYG